MHAFSQLMQVYNVVAYRACATSAMRDSSNGAEIVRYISEKSGIHIEIINGLEEARIVYDSHIVDEFEQDGNFVYVDVGGGQYRGQHHQQSGAVAVTILQHWYRAHSQQEAEPQ